MALTDLVPFAHRRRPAARSGSANPFERLHEEMDRLFEDFMPQASGLRGLDQRAGFLGALDLSETEEALELKVDLPGIDEDKIEITLRDGALFIHGEREEEKEEKKKNFYRSERSFGFFSRNVPLPCEVDEDKIDAQFKKGVLTVRLPKTADAKRSERKIPIQHG